MTPNSIYYATTLGNLLTAASIRWPEREALVYPDRRVTWAQLHDRALLYARGFCALGIKSGDRVGIMSAGGVDGFAVLFAASMIGAVWVPINTRYRAAEIRHVVQMSGISVLAFGSTPADPVDREAILTSAFPSLTGLDENGAIEIEEAPQLRSIICWSDVASSRMSQDLVNSRL